MRITLLTLQAFTHWVNTNLQPKGRSISDLHVDFGNGLNLIALLEQLTNSKLSQKHIPNPKSRVHYIENIHLGLMLLKPIKSIKLAQYGAEGKPSPFNESANLRFC